MEAKNDLDKKVVEESIDFQYYNSIGHKTSNKKKTKGEPKQ